MIEAYKIGVSIVLANNVSPVLAIIGKDLLGINTSVAKINQNLAGWGTAIAGVGSILAGSALLGAMTKIAEKAADFQDTMTKISQLNPKVAELVKNGEIQKLSFDQASKLGMKVEDVSKIYGGIYGVLQDPKEAEELTPIAARYARLMQMRNKGSHPEESINKIMRAGELSGRLTDEKGAIDPKKVEDWFDTMARLQAATHGQFNADTALGLAQQGGGVALRGLSQEGYEHMAIVAQMMGGQRAGTSLMSLRSQMGGGSMMKRSAEAMQEYGLLKDGEWSSEGGHVALSEGASQRLSKMVSTDPMKFVNELVDRLEAKGINNKDDQMTALQRILGRQTTQRMVADMLLAREQIKRETAGLEQGVTVKGGLAGYDGNIHAAQQNLTSAWHNLMVAIGGPEAERFAAFINKIAGAINIVTEHVRRLSPEQIDSVFKVVGGLAVGLIALGAALTAAVITSIVGLPGLFIAAGVALAGLFGTLAALNWSDAKAWLNSDSISQWLNKSLIEPISAWLQSHSIASAIGGWFDAGWNGMNSWLQSHSIANAVSQWLSPITSFFNKAPAPDTKGFTEELKKQNGMFTPMRFDPGTSGPTHQQFAFALNIDGDTLAQTVINKIETRTTFPTSAPSADRSSRWAAGDDNYSDYA